MPWKDPDVIGRYLMAVSGTALYGLYLFAVRVRSGRAVTWPDVLGLLTNTACALACGLILTFALADRIAAWIPWPSLRDAGLLAFAFGVLGFELLPLLFPKALSWAEKQADKLGDRQ
jgi:hypothetical protein